MRLSVNQICLLAAVGLMLVGVAAAASAAATTQPVDEGERHKLPALFDFDNYKRVFAKSYTSLAEELERKRLYFARAFAAFLTGAKYKFRLLTYWRAVNHLSDMSEPEAERRLNKALVEEARVEAAAAGTLEQLEGRGGSGGTRDLPEFIAAEGEDVEAEVEQIVEGREFRAMHDVLAADAGAGRRVRRSAEAKLREFSLEQLIADPRRIEAVKTREASERTSARVKSNNPHYRPIEVASFGLWDQQEDVKWVHVAKHDTRSLAEQFGDSMDNWFGISSLLPSWVPVNSGYKRPEVAANDDGSLPDAMFVDMSQSECMFTVRNQGECGSCYAFASIAIMEYLYCRKSGKLVAFSEQYMIDCGKGRFWGSLQGCDGGKNEGVAKFIHNFGLETRKHFPYAGKLNQCPYAPDQDLKQTGFIRTEIGTVAVVHMSDWHEALEHGPLYVVLAVGADWFHYGGGVYDASGCRWPGSHAMVLVGHGREDGQEFWLLRNSHGRLWGELGYMKLSKEHAHKCATSKDALAFGTSDGINYDQFEPKQVEGKVEVKSEIERAHDELVAYIKKYGVN